MGIFATYTYSDHWDFKRVGGVPKGDSVQKWNMSRSTIYFEKIDSKLCVDNLSYMCCFRFPCLNFVRYLNEQYLFSYTCTWITWIRSHYKHSNSIRTLTHGTLHETRVYMRHTRTYRPLRDPESRRGSNSSLEWI